MIYTRHFFLAILIYQAAVPVSAFLQLRSIKASTRSFGVPDWLVGDDTAANAVDEYTLTVRFINTPSGKDVIVEKVEAGSTLLAIGDSVGIELPRACRTGLCGSCTCEVQDPLAIKTPTNCREGFATVRACSTKCYLAEGMQEMVVDVQRMRKIKKKGEKKMFDNQLELDRKEEEEAFVSTPQSL